MSGGRYLMERGWQDHPLFDKEPYSLRDAWEWLIANACYAEARQKINGTIVTIKRGQLSHSVRFLAEKFMWNKSKVERFLKKLKTETMIETEIETGQAIITICNYNEYQTLEKNSETVNRTEVETGARQERDRSETKKKENNKTNTIKERNISVEFEAFWILYPKKIAKKTALQKFTTARKTTELEIIMDGLRQYLTSRKVIEGFICNPETWLGQERWNDDHQPEKENAASRNLNQPRSVQAQGIPAAGVGNDRKAKLDSGYAEIIARRNAEWDEKQQQIDVTPDSGLPRLTEHP